MRWRVLIGLVKTVLAVALFAMASRMTELTGLQVGLIDPVATAISQTTGLSVRHSEDLLIGLIAYCLVRVVSAACECIRTSIHYVPAGHSASHQS
jgi:hypothetical protein